MKMLSSALSFLPILLAALILLGCAVLFSGCYTLKQGFTMLGYLNRAVPLESLVDSEDAAFAERVRNIRRFAIEELGLKDTANYTRYVVLDRDYLAAVVSAAAVDSFTRHEWWFPVVGKVPYKGFFKVDDARKEGEKLKKRGLDVWIRGVDAFSTLGWFKDPLYSYMQDYPLYRLADLIIHETLHATVYLPGLSQFNEELAEFVGSEGARLYMEKTFGVDSNEYRAMLESEKNSAAFITFIQGLIGELDVLYSAPGNARSILPEKERIIKEAQQRFLAEYDSLFSNEDYRGFAETPVNNAYLELYRLYYAEDNFYQDIYERSGSDLLKFIGAAKTIKSKGNPKAQLEAALLIE